MQKTGWWNRGKKGFDVLFVYQPSKPLSIQASGIIYGIWVKYLWDNFYLWDMG